MTKDFAKQHRTSPEVKPQPRWPWFASGFFSGGFIAFLITLWFLVPAEVSLTNNTQPTPTPSTRDAENEEMQWDFYEIFPRSEVPVVEEYTDAGKKVVVDDHRWILQAGSFKDPDDADERRAMLLLLGLDVQTQPVKVEGSTWHRVIVGPFDSTLERNRAQDKLAQAQVQSIPMKIPKT